MQFSVVIPVYNVKPYLDTCVRSILSQTFTDFEMLLIDDGSTDGSGAICDAWTKADNRIRVFHQQNQGPAVARNAGIRQAKGDYILFLDSDDYWHAPDGLEQLQTVLQKQKQPLDVILFGYRKVNLKTGKEIARLPILQPQGQTSDEQKSKLLAKRQYGNSACTKLVRRTFLLEHDICFPPGRKSEDLVYCRKLLTEMQDFTVCFDTLLTYQINRKGSRSTSFDSQNYLDILEQMQEDLAALEYGPSSQKVLGRAYWAEQVCWFLGYLPLSGRHLQQTIQECQTAFAVLPDGLSRRTNLVRQMTAILGKTLTVRLLHRYLQGRNR